MKDGDLNAKETRHQHPIDKIGENSPHHVLISKASVETTVEPKGCGNPRVIGNGFFNHFVYRLNGLTAASERI
ncbi:hypothetical protein [Sphingomicrobium astaxanthinifaciens]|uniref:hypothetical protein n=1 Tax=Sphingomicrobium astaxanthinifaciens TaxID=1227949 RepID=UPI001FCC3E16|nr:hypothetical protein [Sphingomicrobium astaxanthinifaciens]MCJ7420426.1 hypothetical protein [Sphingomicrobium astaxanthinifaciens]